MKEERDERKCYERGMRGVGKRVSVSSVRTGLSKDKFTEEFEQGV